MFPRLLTEREARFLWNTRACFSPLWLLRVMGNCFWFLDRPPVSKALNLDSPTDVLSKFPSAPRFCSRGAADCSASRDRFLHWQRMRILCDTIDTRGLLDSETFSTDRSSKYRQTDTWKSAKKTVWFGKSLHVQSKVLVNWDLWEAGNWVSSRSNVISMIPGSTIWSTKNHCIIRGPVGRTHGQTLLFLDID